MVNSDRNILLDKWKLESVIGLKKESKPELCVFKNIVKAIEMINKHIKLNSKMVFHTDVDVDGVGTTYIVKKTFDHLGSNNHVLMINQDKVHGILQKHADFFKTYPIGLMVITDSSSNEIEVIKQFNCDVLCIDHHELLQNDLSGYCNDGEHQYVIVNNTIDNNESASDIAWLQSKNPEYFKDLREYTGDSAMSCGLVVYELLRVYCGVYADVKLMDNLKLYQWAGVTLYTDVIDTLNARNQWYLDNTVFSQETELGLGIMMRELNRYKATLDKSYIQYKFAPTINKAIRANQSNEVINKIINEPHKIKELDVYKKLQDDAIERATTIEVMDNITGAITRQPLKFSGDTITLDLGKKNIHVAYTGVIASKLSGDNSKNVAVYKLLANGKYKGSFRGRYKTVNYRKFFEDYADDIYAQGHPPAFGFELFPNQLEEIMSKLETIEPVKEKPFLTAGNMSEDEKGIYHIDDMNSFKRQGYIMMLATGNSKVTSSDEIYIRVKADDVKYKKSEGSVLYYDVLGLECKAFKPLNNTYYDVYVEYTNEITIFIK